jgi:membrane associated rhomboid family serine protease
MNSYRPQQFSTLPLVIKNLIIINVLFFLASLAFQHVTGGELSDYVGLHYPIAKQFMPYQFLTYMFMHGSFSHLFFNMFALWMFGNILENIWGPKKFLLYFFVTGIGAALTHYAIFYFQISPTLGAIDHFLAKPSTEAFAAFRNSQYFAISSTEMQNTFNAFASKYNELLVSSPRQAIAESVTYMYEYREGVLNAPVVIGASGAVFGVLLAFGMMFPNSLIYLYFFIPIKAKWFVMIYGAIELFSGVAGLEGDNVAHFAHLGGMITGFALLYYWDMQKKKKKLF